MFKRKDQVEPTQSPEKFEGGTLPVPDELDRSIIEGFPIKLEINDIDGIYDTVEQDEKQTARLANTLLRSPAESISVHIRRDMGYFALYATITLSDKDDVSKVMKTVTKEIKISSSSDIIDERGGALIVPSPEGTPIAISKGRYYSSTSDIVVTNSKIQDGYDSFVDVLPELKLSRSTFEESLNNVLAGVALVLASTYRTLKKDAPEQEIFLKIERTRSLLDYSSSSNSENHNAPEDISKKFGVEFPKISFDDIGGQTKAKEEIKGIAFAIVNPELYKKWGTTPPKGVLFHGPPGTGKTLLAKALASEAEAAFYAISPSDIASKWYGDSEKRIRDIFAAAAEQERALIYFDELDAIVPDRDNGTHEATQKVISVILQNMDGMASKDNVLVIASTNRIDAIDKAMLRPGRLDKLVEVSLPNEADRVEIIGIHAKNAEDKAERVLFDDTVDYEKIASLIDKKSGADIAEVIRRTLEMKVREESASGIEPSLVSNDDILLQISEYERHHDQ